MTLQTNFTLAQIGEILDKNPSTLRTHINRGLVVGQGPRNSSGDKPAGKHVRFSYYTLMEFALAYEMANLGVQLESAFKYAADFAHAGGGGAGLPERLPALPFHHSHGITIFAAGTRGTTEDLMKPRESYDTLGNLLQNTGGGKMIVVDASDLFNRLCGSINAITGRRMHPYEVLDAEYQDPAT
ncbi:hypothetical protein [Mangrovicoccus sp. HB161399]|uniref:hypothetical protein n=1 Tax=Mangrovicoccus sp. HB161399 TaxID=2720392 RepID=UPI001551C5AE|nr:hypothetical protein [Mangrovicoccus sp. HB161399]